MNKNVADQISRIYYYTIGRFIEAGSLYRIDLEHYQLLPCSINRDKYEFFVTDKYILGLDKHYEQVKGKNLLVIQNFETGKYLCFAYLDKQNQEIAYTRWICKNEFYSDVLNKQLIFKPNEILTLDSYTKPGYRGQHLHRDMNIEMLNWLKLQQEYRYVYMVIKSFIPYLTKYPKSLGYRRILTKVRYKKGSISEFCKLVMRKLKRITA